MHKKIVKFRKLLNEMRNFKLLQDEAIRSFNGKDVAFMRRESFTTRTANLFENLNESS